MDGKELTENKGGTAQKKAHSFRLKALPKGTSTGFYNLDETIANYPVLSKEELNAKIESAHRLPSLFEELEKAKKAGDEAKESALEAEIETAKKDHETAILSNLRLVIKIAKEVSHSWGNAPFDDLVQDGVLGLEKAIERFDPSLGFAFSTFATNSIKEAIRVSLRNSTQPIRISERLLEDQNKVKIAGDALSQKLGRTPTLEELAKETGFTPSYVDECRNLPLGGPLSLDSPIREGDSAETFNNSVVDEEGSDLAKGLDEEEEEESIQEALKTLSPRERDVVIRSFGLDGKDEETLESIGKSYGISRERVRQIREAALHKMGKDLKDE